MREGRERGKKRSEPRAKVTECSCVREGERERERINVNKKPNSKVKAIKQNKSITHLIKTLKRYKLK